uniref:Uncharacterized protein n=1 Tax=Solanum lycopersicum TaxID=4081 RepID=A0A3Q7HGY1_SOLLC
MATNFSGKSLTTIVLHHILSRGGREGKMGERITKWEKHLGITFQVGAAVVIFKELGNQKQSDHSQWQLFPIHKLK